MLAVLKADLVAVKAWLATAEAYVVTHYKQLALAAVVGKWSAAIYAAAVALVHSL